MSTSLSRTQRAANFLPTLAWNTSAIFRSFLSICVFVLFFQVKSDARTLREALGFQLQLDGCKREVMSTANVCIWERPFVCFVDAALEAFGCQDQVYKSIMVVNLPIRVMPGCCPRQLVGVQRVGKGERMALCEL